MEPRVVDNPGELRWEVWLGDTLAGFTTYARSHGVVTYLHTEVDAAFEGQGLASLLARTALDAARAEGLRVRPQCPFVRAYVAIPSTPTSSREPLTQRHVVPADRHRTGRAGAARAAP